MFIKPSDSLLVFFSSLSHEPNDELGFMSCRISDELTEVAVVGDFELILNNDFPAGVLLLRKYVHVISANIGFYLNEFYTDADFIAQKFEIVWLG